MTLFPICLLVLALLTFVVGVAKGSTTLDYLSIIASAVAFVLVLVLGRFGQNRRASAAMLADDAPRGERAPRVERAPRARRAPAPDLFAGYEQLRIDDSFAALNDDDLLSVAESPTPTSAFGVGQVNLQRNSGTRLEPYEPVIPASSPLARILLERSGPPEPRVFSGPPTQAIPAVSRSWDRPRMFDREVDDAPEGEPLENVPDVGADPVEANLVDDVEFPIADYDDLRIDEIVPLLPELEADEIEVVRARERSGANRGFILRRLDVLEARLVEAERSAPIAPAPIAPAPIAPAPIAPAPIAPAPRPSAPRTVRPAPSYGLRPAEPAPPTPERPARPAPSLTPPRTYGPPPAPPAIKIPAVQPRIYGTPAPTPAAAPVSGPAFSEGGYEPLPSRGLIAPEAAPGDPPRLPIEDYDQLRVIDILAVLSDLDADEMETIRRYEVAGACRAPILRQIELVSASGTTAPRPGEAPAEAAPPAPAQRRTPRSWNSGA